MGRLIDADALFPNGVFIVDGKNPMKSITELLNRIANAPTAYNLEKVVEELEEKMVCGGLNVLVYNQGLSDAIDIVKRGGVEW